MELRDDDPDKLEIYLQWLYCGTVPTRDEELGKIDDAKYLQLAQAHLLGDTLRDYNFKDVIIDAILHKSLSWISDGTPDGTCFSLGSMSFDIFTIILPNHQRQGNYSYKIMRSRDLDFRVILMQDLQLLRRERFSIALWTVREWVSREAPQSVIGSCVDYVIFFSTSETTAE